MDRKSFCQWHMAFLAVIFFATPALAGSLDPPASALSGGSPVPTMRTLDEVQSDWTQAIPIAQRFVLVLNGAAYQDLGTGLVWTKQTSNGTGFPWANAVNGCYTDGEADTGAVVHSGWRLPTVEEVQSLMGATGLPAGHPFSILASNVWTSTTYPDGTITNAYVITLSTGAIIIGNRTTGNSGFWCVRTGRDKISAAD